MTMTDHPTQSPSRPDRLPPVIANLLALGFTMPLLLAMCRFVEFPQGEIALLAFVVVLVAILLFPALWLARTLRPRVLIFGGLAGHLLWVTAAALFIQRALEPHT